MQPLEPELVERVLAKLGFAAAPAADLPGLRALYAAWCRRVPYDNVWRRIQVAGATGGRYAGTVAPEFFAAWLQHGAGGTCFAGTGAMHALLAALGFQAHIGHATMLRSGAHRPNHATVTVELDGRWYMLDGSLLHGEPLPLPRSGTSEVAHPAWGVKSTVSSGFWHVRWRPFRVDASILRLEKLSIPWPLFDEEAARDRRASPMTFQLGGRVLTDRGVVGLVRGERALIDLEGRTSLTPLDRAGRRRCLVEDFGISEALADRVPDDTPVDLAALRGSDLLG